MLTNLSTLELLQTTCGHSAPVQALTSAFAAQAQSTMSIFNSIADIEYTANRYVEMRRDAQNNIIGSADKALILLY